MPTEPGPQPRGPIEPDEETLVEPLSAPLPEYPTLQEATAVTYPEYTSERGTGPEPAPAPANSRRNSADPVSIAAGLVFFLLGGAYLLAAGGHLTVNAGWTLSFLLLGLGLSGVVGGFLRARRNSRSRTNRNEW